MKQLAVISGKGGTGKTSLAASFARLAGPCVLVDADVEAANAALLAPGEDQPWRPFLAGQTARVNSAACIRCGTCTALCRFGAAKLEPDAAAVIDALLCEGCLACRLGCPADAIQLEPRQAGRWTVRETAYGPLVHARLELGQGSSGKLVAAVRDQARTEAESRGLELVVIDGPPGTGCPVHAAITGVDLIVVVVEPTVTGAGTLQRTLALAEHFRTKAAVVVNKNDLAPAAAASIEPLAQRAFPCSHASPSTRRCHARSPAASRLSPATRSVPRSSGPGRRCTACCMRRGTNLETSMPLYEFFCPTCQTQRELLLSLAEASSARCPTCGAALERCLTAPAAYRNAHARPAGLTCCGREERCDTPPCGPGGHQGCCHGGK